MGSRNGLCLDRGVKDRAKKWLPVRDKGQEIADIQAQCGNFKK